MSEIDTRLRLRNDSEPAGDGYWSWSVWVDGPADELARIESVTYRLHPTFPQPVQEVTDASTGFRLRTAGWGEFRITAKAKLRDGTTVPLEHWLVLGPRREADRYGTFLPGVPTLLIASSAADAELAGALKDALRECGIEARSDADLDPAVDLRSSLQSAVQRADGVVAIFSDAESPWIDREVQLAVAARKPVFPVVIGQVPVPEVIRDVAAIHVSPGAPSAQLAQTIAARIKDGITPEET